jgi:hypothetical protein
MLETNPNFSFDRQRVLDEEHLRLLSIAHYIAAGFNALIALFGFAYGSFFSPSC